MYNLKRYTNKEKNPPKEILKKKLRSKETNECQTNKQQQKNYYFYQLKLFKKHYFPQNNRTLQVYILYLRQFY